MIFRFGVALVICRFQIKLGIIFVLRLTMKSCFVLVFLLFSEVAFSRHVIVSDLVKIFNLDK